MGIILFLIVTAVAAWGFYSLFYSDPQPEERYWYWDATVTFVWYDAPDTDKDYALGRGRYKIRLPNGRHEAARSFLEESFEVYDCVNVRQHLSVRAPIQYEIIGRADECWQPD